jgi:predicted MFS family arabinose efflux permease
MAKLAFRFVLLLGIVSLFADMTYEGARGIAGPFLGSLGASAAVVGFVAGFGELLGYSLRSVFGYLTDKTHRYWAAMILGYAINLLAVPALALAGNWQVAALLLITERTGRAIRRPAVQAMLSHAGNSIGRGWAFGFHEALDQTGATIGPLITALVLYRHGGYHKAFAVLLVSALLSLAALAVARILYPRPQELEERSPVALKTAGFSKAYWVYVAAGALIAAGFADFSLIAFHFQKAGIVSESLVPVLYAGAMLMGALASLVFGRLLDKLGLPVVLLAFLLGALFAPLVFLGGFGLAVAGVLCWGIGMGAQDSLLKAVLAEIVAPEKRSVSFGIFDTAFGIAWFLGSAAMGLLYRWSIPGLVAFSVALQLAALPVFVVARRQRLAANPA